jgi:putative oxidoreductase
MKRKIFRTEFPSQGHLALLVFRICAGAFMLTHGIPKLTKLLSGDEIQFADPYGFGPTASFVLVVFAEFVCSILVMLGLGTRLAVIPLIINMSTAAIFAHANDPFAVKEKALLFLIIFFLLLVVGPGRYSLDHAMMKKIR